MDNTIPFVSRLFSLLACIILAAIAITQIIQRDTCRTQLIECQNDALTTEEHPIDDLPQIVKE